MLSPVTMLTVFKSEFKSELKSFFKRKKKYLTQPGKHKDL